MAPMRALIVVVQAILVDERLEMALIDDQHPVEAFPTATSDPALRMCIRPRRHEGSQHHAGTLRCQDPIRQSRELLVPIVNQDAEFDPFSSSFQLRLRACWATQEAFGSEVQLASKTRREARCT